MTDEKTDSLATQLDEAEKAIEEVSKKCAPSALVAMNALRKSVMLSKGIRLLEKALTHQLMDAYIMPLQGSPLGYLTDRQNAKSGPTSYSEEEVKAVMTEAIIRGLQFVGNEINIIGGKCYAAKAGVKRLCEEWPGVSCLTLTPGVPEMAPNNTALIAMRAKWLQNGTAQEYYRGKTATDDTRIAVRVNAGMGPDAIIGKAERKMYAAILGLLSNGAVQMPDGDAIEAQGVPVVDAPPVVPPEQEGRRTRVGPRPKHDANGEVQPDEPGSNG